jgi:hypothetical protein
MDYVIPPPSAAAAGLGSALSSNRVGGIDEQSGIRFKTRVKLIEGGGLSTSWLRLETHVRPADLESFTRRSFLIRDV